MRQTHHMAIDTDLGIIDRILAGEESIYAELVDRYKAMTFTLAYKVLQDRAEAEEAAQDAFIKAFQHLRQFNRQAKFSTWLYRIAFNTAISYKRKAKPAFKDIEQVRTGASPDVDGSLEDSDKKKYVDLALRRLNDADRTALSLYYLQELSLEEIAEIMNMQANTIKVRIHRARQRIAEELQLILKKEALTL